MDDGRIIGGVLSLVLKRFLGRKPPAKIAGGLLNDYGTTTFPSYPGPP